MNTNTNENIQYTNPVKYIKCSKGPLDKNNDDEGLLTTIWGPSFWESLHAISFHYPHNPTPEQKEHYKNYFKTLCHVLPCSTCSKHYTDFIYNNPNTMLTDEHLVNRETLTYWLWLLHKTIDETIGIIYDITYEDVCKKYNNFIANCELSIEKKAIAYKSYYNKEAPIIAYDKVKEFEKYAIKRGFNKFLYAVNKTYNIKTSDNSEQKWIKRNNYCWKLIKKMRLEAITCLEQTGEFKGLPTREELILMLLLSTTMTTDVIDKVIKKLRKYGY
jgi:hypothetical protein